MTRQKQREQPEGAHRGHGSKYWVSGYPRLVAEWHPTKNGVLLPSQVSFGSKRRIWWKCAEGADHEWQADPGSRTTRRRGCPFCRNRSVSITNSLATAAPELAQQWHPTRNGKLTPRGVAVQSHRQVWWRCSVNPKHAWRANLANRWWLDTGCPFCSGQRVSVNNALSVAFPKLAREWDRERNGRSPRLVATQSHLEAWWRCSRDPMHRWQSRVGDRAGPNAAGCPVCTGKVRPPKKSSKGPLHALATTFPELAKEWIKARNGSLSPMDISYGSHTKVWWRCPQNRRHVWQAAVSERTRSRGGTGCPYCAGKRFG